MKKLSPPAMYRSRIEGKSRVTWCLPFPLPPTQTASRMVMHLAVYYFHPALRAYYTPNRHYTTNVLEAIRLFDHAEQFVSRLQEEWGVSKKENGNRVQITAWVNYRLSEDDKSLLSAEPLAMEKVIAEFATMAYAGYRLSVSYDSYSQAMQASLVCVNEESADSGLGLSARHPDLDWALRSLLYKAQVIGTGNWADFTTSPKGESWS